MRPMTGLEWLLLAIIAGACIGLIAEAAETPTSAVGERMTKRIGIPSRACASEGGLAVKALNRQLRDDERAALASPLGLELSKRGWRPARFWMSRKGAGEVECRHMRHLDRPGCMVPLSQVVYGARTHDAEPGAVADRLEEAAEACRFAKGTLIDWEDLA